MLVVPCRTDVQRKAGLIIRDSELAATTKLKEEWRKDSLLK
jgi:hypothetical protein